MTDVRTPEARKLCTASELALFLSSLPRSVQKLGAAQLRKKVALVRRARDKYRALAHSQRREARGKQEARRTRPAEGNLRTRRKAELFTQALARLTLRLAQVEDQEGAAKDQVAPRAKGKNGRSSAKPSPKKSAKVPRGRVVAKNAKPPGVDDAAADEPDFPAGRNSQSKGRAPRASLLAANLHGSLEKMQLSRKAMSKATEGLRNVRSQKRMGARRVQSHLAAAGRRKQGKRDSR